MIREDVSRLHFDLNMKRNKRYAVPGYTFYYNIETYQENLLLSIIPKHIASRVGDEVRKFINNLDNEGVTDKFR